MTGGQSRYSSRIAAALARAELGIWSLARGDVATAERMQPGDDRVRRLQLAQRLALGDLEHQLAEADRGLEHGRGIANDRRRHMDSFHRVVSSRPACCHGYFHLFPTIQNSISMPP